MRNAYCFFYVFLVKYIDLFRKMKNKNKHLGFNDFEKNNDLALFESKFVYTMKRDPLIDYEESTPYESKLSAAENLISNFNERFAPEEIPHAGASIDSIVHGVRHSLMQGPLADLNAENILNERVRSKLEWASRNAPEHYKQIIDQMARAQIGAPGIPGRIWNTLTFRRRSVEREVARELFTYNIQAGQNYDTLTNAIEGDIATMGLRAVNGVPINFGNPNEITTFTVAPGPRGVSTGGQVILDWYNHDYDRLDRNLKKAGIWDDPSVQEFMLLKFRHTLLTKFNNEERAKLSSERYNKERLMTWLKIETSRMAMQDEQYGRWVEQNTSDAGAIPPRPFGPNMLDFYANAEDMQTGNPVLYNELQRNQMEAETRSQTNSLEGMLRDILGVKHVEEMKDTDEMKALLAYLQTEYEDDLEGPRVHEFIRSLAGRARGAKDTEANKRADELNNRINELRSIDEVILSTKSGFHDRYNRFADLDRLIKRKSTALKLAHTAARGGDAIGKISQEITELLNEKNKISTELVSIAFSLVKLLNGPGERQHFINDSVQLTHFRDLVLLHKKPNPNKVNDVKAWLLHFFNELNDIRVQSELEALKNDSNKHLKNAEKELNELNIQKEGEEEKAKDPQKMDPRGLLYKLVVRDLENRGLSAESNLQKQALFATNALIAQSRHHEIYGQTNKNVARTLEGSWFGRTFFRNSLDRFIPQGWTSVMSTKEILGHVVDSDPDLVGLSRINVLSSRKDLMDAIKNSGGMTPEKLRSMQEKLALFIAGVEVPNDRTIAATLRKTGEKISDTLHIEDNFKAGNRKTVLGKRFRVRNDEAPMLENVIHILSLLESQLASERSLKTIDADIQDKIASGEELNKSELQLQHLEEMTEASQATDRQLEDEVDNTLSPMRRRLIFKQLRRDYYQAMEETRGMPGDERDAELTRMGFSKRVRAKGLFSMRARWWTKEIGKETIKLPFKALYHGFNGIRTGVKASYKWLFGTEVWKKSTDSTVADIKSILRAPILVAAAPFSYSIKILASLTGRPLDKAAVKSINKSYANINQETNPQ